MKTILNKFGEEPFILHLPGNGMKDFYQNISFVEDKPISYNENIHIIYICTPNIDSPLERQLIRNKIPYTNIVSYINDDYLKVSKKWSWMYKHIAIKRFLHDTETLKAKKINEWTVFIVLDASDVFINKLENIVSTYNKYWGWQRIVFCGTKSDYPNECFYDIPYNKTPTVKSDFCVFINCGGYICTGKWLLKLTNAILKYNSIGYIGDYELNNVLLDDDQYLCKIMQKRHALGYKKLVVDENCRIFQSASACTKITETDNLVIID